MKAVFATVVLSIVSAIVGVFSITQLCGKPNITENANNSVRTHNLDSVTPRQKIQQWINH